MAMNRMAPRHPQMPAGTEVAAFRTHEAASEAVEKLAESDFPVNTVTIVGSDLHLTEKIMGKLTPARVAFTGATQGLTWGLLMAVFSILFYPEASVLIPLVLIVVGVLLGMLLNTASWALSSRRGRFAAQSSLVASRYAILVTEMPDRAFSILSGVPGNLTSTPRRPVRRESYPAPKTPGEGTTPLRETSQAGPYLNGLKDPESAQNPASPQNPESPGHPESPERLESQWSRVSEESKSAPVDPSKPSEYGSRPDERPRFGVRLSGEEKQNQGLEEQDRNS